MDDYSKKQLREKALNAKPIGDQILKNSKRVRRDSKTIVLVRNIKNNWDHGIHIGIKRGQSNRVNGGVKMKKIEKIIYDTTRELTSVEDKLGIAVIFLVCYKLEDE